MEKKKNKVFLIEVMIIVLFFLFLVSIPSFFKEDINVQYYKLDSKSYSDSSAVIEQTKFDIMTKAILDEFKTETVGNSYLNYVLTLVSDNKINNRENTIAQEVITYYLKNQTAYADNLSYYFLQNRLDDYDLREDQKWRNYLFVLVDNNTDYILHEDINLLVDIIDAKILGKNEIIVKPYEFQRYIIKKENKEIIEIFVDLFKVGDRKAKLSQYINTSNNLPIGDNEIIHIDFIESEREFGFKLYIWK